MSPSAPSDALGGALEELNVLRLLAEHVPAMLAYWDASRRCRFANSAYTTWFGVTPEWLVGRTMVELLGPLYPLNLPYIDGVLAGKPQTFEREIPDPAGAPSRHGLAHYEPHLEDGVVKGFFVLVTDISAIRLAEHSFRQVVETSPIPYALNDDAQHITYLNPAFMRVFGYTREDLPTLAEWWPLAYPDPTYREWVSSEWSQRLEAARREGRAFEPLEVLVRAKDGTIKTVIAYAASFGLEKGDTHLVVLYDVTEARSRG